MLVYINNTSNNIMDISKYYSTSGMKTKEWGQASWKHLFVSIMGAYPVVVDKQNKEHKRIKKSFYYQFYILQDTLPCIFCRNSYQQFFNELPIKNFMDTRLNLMYWLYLIKDKVNQKLIIQEKECFDNEKKKLDKQLKLKRISKKEHTAKIKKITEETFITKPSPPFSEILDYYESFRAGCSVKAQTCK